MIKGKAPDEIRKTFNIKNDFTPAEEEQVRFYFIMNFLFCFFLTWGVCASANGVGMKIIHPPQNLQDVLCILLGDLREHIRSKFCSSFNVNFCKMKPFIITPTYSVLPRALMVLADSCTYILQVSVHGIFRNWKKNTHPPFFLYFENVKGKTVRIISHHSNLYDPEGMIFTGLSMVTLE